MTGAGRRVRDWLPVIVAAAFFAGALATQAISHPGEGDLLHSGHNDRMNGTLTAKNFKFKPAKTFKYTVPAAAFFGEAGDAAGHSGYSGAVGVAPAQLAIAPVQLPVGARITKVEWFLNFGDDVSLFLQENVMTGVGDHANMVDLAGTSCSGDPCKVVTTDIDPSVIKASRHYGLVLQGESEFSTTYKVVITYTLNRPTP
ncbi:MAG TPA: hypothetical protein VEV82_03440 [Actinomycetota bacterium]|nr:hypothetical protein [Actinomycetota bacterium]